MSRYIFVTGGVMSGIGKGVATASIGRILQSKGFTVTAMKADPYINVDAGTMNPIEHGEVFVTEDGMECDQDMGNYERFFNANLTKDNYMTTGLVYQTVIAKERNLEYGGKCVEVVPHIPEEVIRRVKNVSVLTKADFVLVEIGGTVGEYQNMLFLEAARMLKLQKPSRVLLVLVSYLPVPKMVGEMKTKPTQHAVRLLNSAGLQPDIILARSVVSLDEPRKRKISVFCNISEKDVISAPDAKFIYEIPMNFEKEKLSERILKKFRLKPKTTAGGEWEALCSRIVRAKKPVKIGIIGKYFETGSFILSDAYLSVIEAVKHAAWQLKKKPVIQWLNSEEYEKNPAKLKDLSRYDGLIVPGGFGKRGVEGKLKAIRYARENRIPFLGLCYGLQMAVVEFARNVCRLRGAHTTEIKPDAPHPVIHILPEQAENLKENKFGGSMRLGSYACVLVSGTKAAAAYGEKEIRERHRHRYEVNNAYREILEKAGLVISGLNPERNLVEIIELNDHPFFVATQFHPELQSKPLRPHPLFAAFVKTAVLKKSKI